MCLKSLVNYEKIKRIRLWLNGGEILKGQRAANQRVLFEYRM
jgi:hypothetical protein